jgi:hypothetical protein
MSLKIRAFIKRMAISTLKWVNNLLYRIKIYIQFQPYPTKVRIYNYRKNGNADLQAQKLRGICQSLKWTEDHELYNKLLKQFIPAWNTEIDEQQFIGHGISEGNLNIYRKVKTENANLFEKVFFSGTKNLRANDWFYKNVYRLVKNEIHIPRMSHSVAGDMLTIVYFEYLDLQNIPPGKVQPQAVEFTKRLYSLSLTDEASAIIKKAPSYLTNYQYSYFYKRHVIDAKQYLVKKGIDIKNIESTLESGQQIFTHGDIARKNMFSPNILLDWEFFGIYPAGFEVSLIYYLFLRTQDFEKKPLDWLKRHYSPLVYKEEWNRFELSFLYFLFIFSYNLFDEENNQIIGNQLLQQLKLRAM